MTEQPRDADDLFGLRPEEFTSARNALAKHLKSEGESQEAARVAALRRPTATAWALNQLARQQPDLVEAVVDAGEKLRQATEQALQGDRSGFAAAQAAERAAIRRAVDGAAKFLESGAGKASEAARQRMTETLRAATVDDSAGDLLRRGVLDSDLSAPGFGMESILADSVSQGRSGPSKRDDDSRRRDREVRHARLQAEVDEAVARLDEAQAAAEEAEARAGQLRRQADRARTELERAKKRLDEGTERSS
jgi:hypothetical protein